MQYTEITCSVVFNLSVTHYTLDLLYTELLSPHTRTDDQVFLDMFFKDKFYLLVCTAQIDKFP